ncbi:Alpha/Beta hydrolase protein [Aspergillus californicus]
MSFLRAKIPIFFLTLLAKLLRAVITIYFRFAFTTFTKPSPDGIEYIPFIDTTTNDKPSPKKSIKVHIYNPPPSPDPNPSKPPATPVLINACGTGFIIPGHGLDDSYCRLIADKAGHTVIDVKYRLAPEHPYPTALEDLVAVVRYILSHPEKYDKNHISIGGFSAGGNIAASVAVNFFPVRTFEALILFYPVLDARAMAKMAGQTQAGTGTGTGTGTQTETEPGSMKPGMGGLACIPARLMKFFQACYLAEGKSTPTTSTTDVENPKAKQFDTANPRISPARADLFRFPRRCLFITAEHDCLSIETEEMAKKLKEFADADGNSIRQADEDDAVSEIGDACKSKREVIVHRVSGCGHTFDKNVEVGSEREGVRDTAYGVVVDFLKEDPKDEDV